MESQTKKTLGSAAVVAWLFVAAGMILAGEWIMDATWRVFTAAVVLGVAYLGAVLTAQWADRA
jgi:hypothetical protein